MTTPAPPSTHGKRPNLGDAYRCKATGLVFTVGGRRSKARSCLLHDASGPGRQVREFVTLDELRDDYELLGCDHSAACCTEHNVHLTPHVGCILR